jgi:hypothetical protein
MFRPFQNQVVGISQTRKLIEGDDDEVEDFLDDIENKYREENCEYDIDAQDDINEVIGNGGRYSGAE